MNIAKYLNKNKIAGIILIFVIIIAFGFGGFGGGFMSNNQNNIAKIDKTNVTAQDLINHIKLYLLVWTFLSLCLLTITHIEKNFKSQDHEMIFGFGDSDLESTETNGDYRKRMF